MLLGEKLLVVKGIDYCDEEVDIDLLVYTDFFYALVAKTKLNIETVDYRNQMMIVVDHICKFHFFADEHSQ